MTLAYYPPFLNFAEKIVRRLFHNKIVPNETLTHFSPPKSPDKHKPHKHKEGETHPCEAHPFDTIHRLRLLKAIMTGKGEGFCGLHFKALQKRKALLAHYPLHDGVALASLADDWLSLHVMPWEQVRMGRRGRYRFKCPVYFDSYPALPPLINTHTQTPSNFFTQPNTRIRDYFGEHTAMYFSFLAHYTTCLALLAVVSEGTEQKDQN
jgi:Calcium-activated chloride channel